MNFQELKTRTLVPANIEQTADGFYRYINHQDKLSTTGFGTKEALSEYAPIIRFDVQTVKDMTKRYLNIPFNTLITTNLLTSRFKSNKMDIYDIKQRTKETSPYFFNHSTLGFFGQTLEGFTVEEQSDGRYLIQQPITDARGDNMGETIRYFNPDTNELENR